MCLYFVAFCAKTETHRKPFLSFAKKLHKLYAADLYLKACSVQFTQLFSEAEKRLAICLYFTAKYDKIETIGEVILTLFESEESPHGVPLFYLIFLQNRAHRQGDLAAYIV